MKTPKEEPPGSARRQVTKRRSSGHQVGMLVTGIMMIATVAYGGWWIIEPPDGWALLFPIGIFGLVASAFILLILSIWWHGRR